MQRMTHRLQKRSDKNRAVNVHECQCLKYMKLGNTHRLHRCAQYFSERGKDLGVLALEMSLEMENYWEWMAVTTGLYQHKLSVRATNASPRSTCFQTIRACFREVEKNALTSKSSGTSLNDALSISEVMVLVYVGHVLCLYPKVLPNNTRLG